MVDPNWAGKIRNWWGSLLEREILSHQRWTASPEELARGIGDVARQARNVFVLHVTACTYAYVALLGSKDADFFRGAAGGGIRLPVLDTQAHPAIFFTAMPVLLIALTVYLNLYLGQLHRLQRRIAWLQRQGPTSIDPDTLYPWIAILAKQRSLFGAVLRIVLNTVVWCIGPYIIVLYWLRLLPFRGLLIGTLDGFGPPSARIVGYIAIALIALVSTWSALRKTIDARFKIGPAITAGAYIFRGAVLVAITIPVVWQWQLQRYVCRHVSIGLCRVDLRQAIISTPPSNGIPNAQGAQMALLNLNGADISGAYLDSANLAHSSLIDAHLPGVSLRNANLFSAHLDRAYLGRAHLEDAELHNSHLPGAFLGYAHLENANFDDAHLEGASFVRAYLEGATFQSAQMAGSQLMQTHAGGAKFEFANLIGAWLFGAQLQAASFWGAHLEGDNLHTANLQAANFLWAALQGADFEQAHLEGANFIDAHLEGASFANAHLEGADFELAHLEGASFEGAYLEGAIFLGSKVEGAQLPLSAERLPQAVVDRLKARSHLDASFEKAEAETICANKALREDWKVVSEPKACLRLQSETLRRLATVSVEFKKIWEHPPAWARWQRL